VYVDGRIISSHSEVFCETKYPKTAFVEYETLLFGVDGAVISFIEGNVCEVSCGIGKYLCDESR
jgi:hypothetical protein